MGKDMDNVKFLLKERNHHNEDNSGRKHFKSTYITGTILSIHLL